MHWLLVAALAGDAAAYGADLDFLLDKIRTTHPAWTHARPAEEWERVAASIRDRLDEVDDHGFAVETLRLFRLLEDGHSALFVPRTPLIARTWQLAMQPFADGVFVTSAQERLRDAVGGRVIALGDRALEVVMRDVDPYTWGDNAEARKRNALRLLSLCDVHKALGLSSDSDHGSVTVALIDGSQRRFELERGASPAEDRAPAGWVAATPADGVEPPLSSRDTRKSWWFEPLEDGSTV
jgi:hypothetical protein